MRDITQATSPLEDTVISFLATEQRYRLIMAQDCAPWFYAALDVGLRPGLKHVTTQYIEAATSSCVVNRIWPALA